MSSKLIIVGKNSQIYQSIRLKLNFDLIELSHTYKDWKICKDEVVVLFSVNKKSSYSNEKLLNDILSVNPKSIILISSMSVLSSNYHYRYPKIKLSQEEVLKKYSNYTILRISTPDWLTTKTKTPDLRFYQKSLVEALKDNFHYNGKQTIELVDYYLEDESKVFKMFYESLHSKLGSRLMRLIDFLIKYFIKSKNYGYAYLSANQYILRSKG